MWHEPDPERRRTIVAALWADDAENYTSKFVVRGMDIFVLREDGRIHALYQFSEPSA
jgi:hypothetical protein